MKVKELKKYKILLRENAGECEKYSAEVLTKYVKKTCGITLKTVVDGEPIKGNVFSIGETALFNSNKGAFDRSELKNDGFRIFNVDGNVFFDSITVRGVMYAVYDFIERDLGVKFLTAKAEYVPTLKEVELPKTERVVKPNFEMMSYNGGGEVFGQVVEKCDFDHFSRTRTKEVFTKIPEKYGGPIKIFGRNTAHNFHYYVPFSKYGVNHYDWYHFYQCNLEIVPVPDITNGITEDGKLDESMEESVAKSVIEEMKKDMDKYPDIDIFMLTQEDTKFFEDENNLRLEKKFKRSGILIRFINVIAREMQKYADEKYPGRKVRLMTFAYADSFEAPVKEVNGKIVPLDKSVVADDNVIIQLALMGNGYFSYFDPRQDERVRKAMEDWHVIAKDFWFWAYDTNWHRYDYFFDSFHHVKEDLEGWKKMGITYLFIESGENRGHWQIDYRGYMYRQLAMDMTRSQEDVFNEFAHYYFGPIEEHVKKIISMYHENYKYWIEEKGEDAKFTIRGSAEQVKYCPIDLLFKVRDVLYDAEKVIENSDLKAEEKQEYLRRHARVMITPLTMINDRFYEYYPEATAKDRKPYHDELVKYYERIEEDTMEVGSLTLMTEFFNELIAMDTEQEKKLNNK